MSYTLDSSRYETLLEGDLHSYSPSEPPPTPWKRARDTYILEAGRQLRETYAAAPLSPQQLMWNEMLLMAVQHRGPSLAHRVRWCEPFFWEGKMKEVVEQEVEVVRDQVEVYWEWFGDSSNASSRVDEGGAGAALGVSLKGGDVTGAPPPAEAVAVTGARPAAAVAVTEAPPPPAVAVTGAPPPATAAAAETRTSPAPAAPAAASKAVAGQTGLLEEKHGGREGCILEAAAGARTESEEGLGAETACSAGICGLGEEWPTCRLILKAEWVKR